MIKVCYNRFAKKMRFLVIFAISAVLLQCAVKVGVVAKLHKEMPRSRYLSPIAEHVKPRSGYNPLYEKKNSMRVSFYPFNAGVFRKGAFICGGVIISEDKVLTSAECVHSYVFERPLLTQVVLREVDFNAGSESEMITVPLEEIVIHPDFHHYEHREDIYYNNVAILKLQFKVRHSSLNSPIALPDPAKNVPAGTDGSLTGWGGETNLMPSPVLTFADDIIVMDHQSCRLITGFAIDEDSFCTVPTPKGTACKYDQGSPLFGSDVRFGRVLLGIVSYGPCDMTYPTIYSSVPNYVSWINSIP